MRYALAIVGAFVLFIIIGMISDAVSDVIDRRRNTPKTTLATLEAKSLKLERECGLVFEEGVLRDGYYTSMRISPLVDHPLNEARDNVGLPLPTISLNVVKDERTGDLFYENGDPLFVPIPWEKARSLGPIKIGDKIILSTNASADSEAALFHELQWQLKSSALDLE